MGKTKKQQSTAVVFLRALAVSLGVYLVGHLVLAALCLRGSVGEEGAFVVTALLCVLSVLLGGLLAARRCPWGALGGGVLLAAAFGAVLALLGFGFWGALDWGGSAAMLLGCALSGGVAAGLLGTRRRKPRRRVGL